MLAQVLVQVQVLAQVLVLVQVLVVVQVSEAGGRLVTWVVRCMCRCCEAGGYCSPGWTGGVAMGPSPGDSAGAGAGPGAGATAAASAGAGVSEVGLGAVLSPGW